TERSGALTHDGGDGLCCCHILMRATVAPNLDWRVIWQPEVDSDYPATAPLAQFARPLMSQHVVSGNWHGIHPNRPQATRLRSDACALDAAQEFGGCEMHKCSHTSSLYAHAPQVKKPARLGCCRFRNGL